MEFYKMLSAVSSLCTMVSVLPHTRYLPSGCCLLCSGWRVFYLPLTSCLPVRDRHTSICILKKKIYYFILVILEWKGRV